MTAMTEKPLLDEDTIADLTEKIVSALKTVYDPEIPVDIYELGLIYDVFVNEDFDAKVLMTLTSPNCPVAESLPAEVEEKLKISKKTLKKIKTIHYGLEELRGDWMVKIVLMTHYLLH